MLMVLIVGIKSFTTFARVRFLLSTSCVRACLKEQKLEGRSWLVVVVSYQQSLIKRCWKCHRSTSQLIQLKVIC